MARDKSRDDEFFNCSQEHEFDYVANQYPGNEDRVKKFLKSACASGRIRYMTHKKVYELIREALGLRND